MIPNFLKSKMMKPKPVGPKMKKKALLKKAVVGASAPKSASGEMMPGASK